MLNNVVSEKTDVRLQGFNEEFVLTGRLQIGPLAARLRANNLTTSRISTLRGTKLQISVHQGTPSICNRPPSVSEAAHGPERMVIIGRLAAVSSYLSNR